MKQAIKMTRGLEKKDNRVYFGSVLSPEKYQEYVHSKVHALPQQS